MVITKGAPAATHIVKQLRGVWDHGGPSWQQPPVRLLDGFRAAIEEPPGPKSMLDIFIERPVHKLPLIEQDGPRRLLRAQRLEASRPRIPTSHAYAATPATA